MRNSQDISYYALCVETHFSLSNFMTKSLIQKRKFRLSVITAKLLILPPTSISEAIRTWLPNHKANGKTPREVGDLCTKKVLANCVTQERDIGTERSSNSDSLAASTKARFSVHALCIQYSCQRKHILDTLALILSV